MMTDNLLNLSSTGSFSTDVLLVYTLAMFFLTLTSFVTGQLTYRRFSRRLERRLEELEELRGQSQDRSEEE